MGTATRWPLAQNLGGELTPQPARALPRATPPTTMGGPAPDVLPRPTDGVATRPGDPIRSSDRGGYPKPADGLRMRVSACCLTE